MNFATLPAVALVGGVAAVAGDVAPAAALVGEVADGVVHDVGTAPAAALLLFQSLLLQVMLLLLMVMFMMLVLLLPLVLLLWLRVRLSLAARGEFEVNSR